MAAITKYLLQINANWPDDQKMLNFSLGDEKRNGIVKFLINHGYKAQETSPYIA